MAEERLEVTTLDVGHGDAILVRLMDGKSAMWTCLVDGGEKDGLSATLRAKPFEVKKLDLLVLTHPDNDHVGGLLEVAKEFKIENYWGPALPALRRHLPLFGRDCSAAIDKAQKLEDALPETTHKIYPVEGYESQAVTGCLSVSVLSPASRLIGELFTSQDIAQLLTFKTTPLGWLIDAAPLNFGQLDIPESFRSALATGGLSPELIPGHLKNPVTYGDKHAALPEAVTQKFEADPNYFGDPLLNNTSIVLYIEASIGQRRHRVVLPGDLENWTYLLYSHPRGLSCDLLKMSHHGGRVYFDSTSSDIGSDACIPPDPRATATFNHAHEEMFQTLRPSAVMMSANGRHGLPRRILRESAIRWGATVFCTSSRSGSVVVGPESDEKCCFNAFGCQKGNGHTHQTVVLDAEGIRSKERACSDGYGSITGPVIHVKQHVISPSRLTSKLFENELRKLIKKVKGILESAHKSRVDHAKDNDAFLSEPLTEEEIVTRANAADQPLIAAHLQTILNEGQKRNQFWASQSRDHNGPSWVAYHLPKKEDQQVFLDLLAEKVMIVFTSPFNHDVDFDTLLVKLDFTRLAQFADIKLRYPTAVFHETFRRSVITAFRGSKWSCYKPAEPIYAFSTITSRMELFQELINQTKKAHKKYDGSIFEYEYITSLGSLDTDLFDQPVIVSEANPDRRDELMTQYNMARLVSQWIGKNEWETEKKKERLRLVRGYRSGDISGISRSQELTDKEIRSISKKMASSIEKIK